MKLNRTLLKLFLLLGVQTVSANNLVIGPPTVSGSTVSFTITWDNSWFSTLGSANYDAVWVFVKRQSCTDNLWVHAPLSTLNVHTATGGLLQVDPVTDGRGVFVRRFAVGSGTIPTATVTVTLQTPANTVDNFQVHGMEMVAVPQGNFQIGYPGNPFGAFNNITITSATQTAGIGVQTNYSVGGSGCTVPLPASFPLGWNNFYAMKYEISQDQYASFLNTLTYNQQTSRMRANPNSPVNTLALTVPGSEFRNGLRIMTPGVPSSTPAVVRSNLNANAVFNENGDGQNIACNHMNWQDFAAYLDWAALRPMTEFEFEKLARGPMAIVPGGVEYVWGSFSIITCNGGSAVNAGTASEVANTSGNGLCCCENGGFGPMRCGFAATAATTRQQAGAGYYGCMDLGGNVFEICVGGRNADYSSFTSVSGDGNLTVNGVADVPGWNPFWSVGSGLGLRGGSYEHNALYVQTFDRSGTTFYGWLSSAREKTVGGRGVRNY